jgi:hypothetical protein
MSDERIALQKRNAASYYDRLIAANPTMPHLRAVQMAAVYVGAKLDTVSRWLESKQ